MITYVLLSLLGVLMGTITGLTPGLHINTVAVVGLSTYPAWGLSAMEFSTVMIAMAVTHTFLDFIPSIFLGVPEEGTALSVLPTHRLLLDGKALEAVELTAIGSLFGVFFSLIFLVPALIVIPLIYGLLRGVVGYVLMAIIAVLILRERSAGKIVWALGVFLISGCLGILVFRLRIMSSNDVLFPVFSGLFGLSNIVYSMGSKKVRVIQDRFVRLRITRRNVFSGLLGSAGGVIVGVLPAMSPSQIGTLIFEIFRADLRNFLIAVSAINTSDAIYSFVSIYTINRARSGVATAVSNIVTIDSNSLLLFVGVSAFVSVFATFLHIAIGRRALGVFSKFNYRRISTATIMLVLVLVYMVTGAFGIFLAVLATVIGLLPILSGVSRTHSMGVLLVPTMTYFFGFG